MDSQTSTTEIWKPILGYEGRYLVSNLGRVKSLYAQRGKRKKPKLLTPVFHPFGYPMVNLSNGVQKRSMTIHKLVLGAFVGPRPTGEQARHLNGDPSDSRLQNLQWGTPKENQADRTIHGTDCCGERSPNTQVTNAQAQEVRDLRKTGALLREIAKAFGFSYAQVQRICAGERFKHGISRIKETR